MKTRSVRTDSKYALDVLKMSCANWDTSRTTNATTPTSASIANASTSDC